MSYEEVAKLIERVSGSRQLSDQKISQIVSNKALKLSQEIYKNAVVTLDKNDLNMLQVNPDVDIYSLKEKEIMLFDDGIQGHCGKKQKGSLKSS